MRSKRILLKIEPFVVQLETSLDSVVDSINHLYGGYTFFSDDSSLFVDFHLKIDKPNLFRGFYKSQVQCYVDGRTPFKPLPVSQAYPFFEWGLNWVVASHIYNYLIVHAAVVEKNDSALILCGKPGAGKSTLCAALINRGWRLLSDEMAVIDLKTNELIPFVRPVSLKNNSINLIKQFAPEVDMGKSFTDTAKGTVAHMRPSKESIRLAKSRAYSKWIVFPQYKQGAETCLSTVSKGETVIDLAKNSFNYNILGGDGFNCLCGLVGASYCYDFEYNDLNEAVDLFASLPA